MGPEMGRVFTERNKLKNELFCCQSLTVLFGYGNKPFSAYELVRV